MHIALVYISVPSKEEAYSLGEQLIKEKHIIAFNMLESQSCFFWEERLHHEDESVLICKTLETRWPKLAARATELHSYEVPCIVKFLAEASPTYFAWMDKNLES